MLSLRPYQVDCLNQLWDALYSESRVLCVLPTASGKSIIFRKLIERADVKSAVILNRDKLVSQTARTLSGLDVGVYAAGQSSWVSTRGVTVASIHSSDDLTIPDLKLIICDEAHNLNEGRYRRFIERHPMAKVVGFTATPWRNNSPIYGEGEFFKRVTFKRSIKQMIDEGWICPAISKLPPEAWRTEGLRTSGGEFVEKDVLKLVSNKTKVRSQVLDALPRLADRKKVIWVCASIEHAEDVAAEIIAAGDDCLVLHSKSPNREYLTEVYESPLGPRHLVSVMMVTEGYDYPAIDAVVLMRPTKSVTLMVQIIGRALRLYPGKVNALCLDYGEVINNCGSLMNPRIREKGKREKGAGIGEITVKVCRECLSYIDAGVYECPDCGAEMQRPRDLTKNTTERAGNDDVMGEVEVSAPVTLKVRDVTIDKHRSKSGNDCIRVDFYCDNRAWPVSMYGARFPKSWHPMQRLLSRITPFTFETFDEALGAASELIVETMPDEIMVERVGGYERVINWRVTDRARDTDRAG